MATTLEYFNSSIGVMFLYSIFITFLVYSIPADDQVFVLQLKSSPAYVSTDNISSKFQSSIQQQQSFGVVQVASLALYSGNILLDLILNFFTAIPSMATIVVNGLLFFMNVPVAFKNAVLLWVYGLVATLWGLSIITMLINIRKASGGIF